MRNPIGSFTPAIEIRGRRADYGIDAPLSGLPRPQARFHSFLVLFASVSGPFQVVR
jgi:hypothetical protein